MGRRYAPEGISHDPEDAPHYTHKVFSIYYPFIKSDIIAIQDDDKTHYPFLKQWVGMEVDIENQWSVNNGTLGLDMVLHNAGAHKMEYTVRLKTTEAKQICKTQYHLMGIINEQKRLIYAFSPINVGQLAEFIAFKIDTDNFVKREHLSPKGWTIE